MAKLSNKIQPDWFDVFMRVPIRRRYVPYSETLAVLAGMKAENVRVLTMEVKAGGYVINTKE